MNWLSNKQISILKILRDRKDGEFLIVPWTNRDLGALESAKFAQAFTGIAITGRLHTSKVWVITDAGRRFLDEERAGQ